LNGVAAVSAIAAGAARPCALGIGTLSNPRDHKEKHLFSSVSAQFRQRKKKKRKKCDSSDTLCKALVRTIQRPTATASQPAGGSVDELATGSGLSVAGCKTSDILGYGIPQRGWLVLPFAILNAAGKSASSESR
jgi:hypothetical protein